MVLKAEQEKLKKLLTEAIPLLCKNGVQFKSEFAIEALIGITLDKDEVVLVSINETVQADFPQDDPADSPSTELYDSVPQIASPVQTDLPHRDIDPRRRKRKTPGRRPSSYTVGSPARESYTNTPVGTPQISEPATPDHSTINDSESLIKKPKSELDMYDSATLTVKKEPIEETDDDLVFVKDDSSDIDLSQMLGQHGEMVSFPNVSLSSQKQRRDHSLSSPAAATGYHSSSQGSQDASFNTEAGPSQQTRWPEGRQTPVLAAALSHPISDPRSLPYTPVVECGRTARLKCTLCDKTYRESRNMMDHIASTHLSIFRHQCQGCGRRFGWRSDLVKHKSQCPCNIKEPTQY